MARVRIDRLIRKDNPKRDGLALETRENQWRRIVIYQFFRKNGN